MFFAFQFASFLIFVSLKSMMKKAKYRLEVCLSPAMYDKHADDENIVVVVDILRATSSICAAIQNGVKTVIPVATVEEAREMKEKGYNYKFQN